MTELKADSQSLRTVQSQPSVKKHTSRMANEAIGPKAVSVDQDAEGGSAEEVSPKRKRRQTTTKQTTKQTTKAKRQVTSKSAKQVASTQVKLTWEPPQLTIAARFAQLEYELQQLKNQATQINEQSTAIWAEMQDLREISQKVQGLENIGAGEKVSSGLKLPLEPVRSQPLRSHPPTGHPPVNPYVTSQQQTQPAIVGRSQGTYHPTEVAALNDDDLEPYPEQNLYHFPDSDLGEAISSSLPHQQTNRAETFINNGSSTAKPRRHLSHPSPSTTARHASAVPRPPSRLGYRKFSHRLVQRLLRLPRNPFAIAADALLWILAAAGLRIGLKLLTASFPVLALPVNVLLLVPALMATYAALFKSQTNLVGIYRLLLIILGLFVGGKL